jgi:hypothetical protein
VIVGQDSHESRPPRRINGACRWPSDCPSSANSIHAGARPHPLDALTDRRPPHWWPQRWRNPGNTNLNGGRNDLLPLLRRRGTGYELAPAASDRLRHRGKPHGARAAAETTAIREYSDDPNSSKNRRPKRSGLKARRSWPATWSSAPGWGASTRRPARSRTGSKPRPSRRWSTSALSLVPLGRLCRRGQDDDLLRRRRRLRSSEVYARHMPDPPPARSAPANVRLPHGLLVSIEAIAVLPRQSN